MSVAKLADLPSNVIDPLECKGMVFRSTPQTSATVMLTVSDILLSVVAFGFIALATFQTESTQCELAATFVSTMRVLAVVTLLCTIPLGVRSLVLVWIMWLIVTTITVFEDTSVISLCDESLSRQLIGMCTLCWLSFSMSVVTKLMRRHANHVEPGTWLQSQGTDKGVAFATAAHTINLFFDPFMAKQEWACGPNEFPRHKWALIGQEDEDDDPAFFGHGDLRYSPQRQ